METQAREGKDCSRSRIGLDKERKEIMSELSKTVLLFRFPFPGPWGKELTEASHELASDIANEHGLVWKIWLEPAAKGSTCASTMSGESYSRRWRA